MVTVPVGKLPDTYEEYDAAGCGSRSVVIAIVLVALVGRLLANRGAARTV
jgi:hypothetical protein